MSEMLNNYPLVLYFTVVTLFHTRAIYIVPRYYPREMKMFTLVSFLAALHCEKLTSSSSPFEFDNTAWSNKIIRSVRATRT